MRQVLRLSLILVLASTQCGLAQTVKVGTFDRTSIVLAFYRSPLWSAKLKDALAERDRAQAAGDGKKVAELSKWGQSQQALAHKQLAGAAPIDNILEMMKPMLTTVQGQTHVTTVIPDPPGARKGAATLDVTDPLLGQLQASAQTRQMAQQLRISGRPARSNTGFACSLFRFAG